MIRLLFKALGLGTALTVWGFGYSVQHGILYTLLLILAWLIMDEQYK